MTHKIAIMTCLFLTGSLHAQSAERPNIVLIMADDVSPDMFSCFDDRTPHLGEFSGDTPNIDAFVDCGVVFETAYAAAMCLPTRVEIMTGKYGATTGVIRNGTFLNGNRNVYSAHLAFAKVLRDAGYSTAIAGKWHAGPQMPYEDEVGFEEYCLWESAHCIEAVTGKPFDRSSVAWEDASTTSRYWHPALLCNGGQLETSPDDFGPDLCCEFICDFIERKAGGEQPFLAYWPMVSPHGSRTGYPTNPSRGEVGDFGRSDDHDKRERFASLVEYIDVHIGRVRETLERKGIAEDTLLIFCSDNATAAEGKTQGVERGCHVVFMAEGAGMKARGFTRQLMDFTDVAPTLLDYAGIRQPKQPMPFDGESLKPFFDGNTDTTKPLIQGFMSTSQTLRAKEHLLEVVNPIMGLPNGRFYYTGENRFWKGYERVDDDPAHAAARKPFDVLLRRYPPYTMEHPYWKTPGGKKYRETWMTPAEVDKHLTNSKNYRFYDQSR